MCWKLLSFHFRTNASDVFTIYNFYYDGAAFNLTYYLKSKFDRMYIVHSFLKPNYVVKSMTFQSTDSPQTRWLEDADLFWNFLERATIWSLDAENKHGRNNSIFSLH